MQDEQTPPEAPRKSFLAVDSTPEADNKADSANSYQIAAGMLAQDLKILPIAFLLLLLPHFVETYVRTLTPDSQTPLLMGLLLLERFVSLTCLYILTNNWINRLRNRSSGFDPAALGMTYLFGFALWLMLYVPLVLQSGIVPVTVRSFGLMLLIPAVYMSLRYFLYFFPIALGIRPASEAFNMAGEMTRGDNWLALRTLSAPLGFLSLTMALALIPGPDGRYAVVDYFEAIFNAIFWVLSTYICLGFCLTKLSNPDWQRTGLDPYRSARLATLEAHGVDLIGKLLQPKSGLKMLGVSLLIWVGNFARVSTMPPTPTISVREVVVEGKNLTVTLTMNDPEFRFRSFLPILFTLAGEKRAVQAETPKEVHIDGEPDAPEYLVSFPRVDSATVSMKFETGLRAKDLIKIEDLYLWYNHVRLEKLEMKNARVIGSLETELPGAADTNRTPPADSDASTVKE
jgi:hypothetical protein